jgi:hypothetical protein
MNAHSSALALAVFVVGAASAAAQPVFFQRQVRGILSDRCFRCHGPDVAERQAGLRLDHEADAKKILESGVRAIAPGKSADSELVARITTADADLKMSPEDSGKTLSASEVDILQRWIAQGAQWGIQWGIHWAFSEVERPQLPELSDTAADVSEIDHFVWARLAGKGLTAAAEADRVALIRRVTLDLNGLPPTIAEVSSFVADSLRDRRSASAQFASLWGTHGAVLAGCRSMWRHTRPASG